jgi:neutral ceramidase
MPQSLGSASAIRAPASAAVILAIVTVTATGLPEPLPQPTAAGAKAGAASTDITPVPGLPTGGYGPAGAVARGYWGRLRATAFYFEDPTGRGLALVSIDLFAVPSALHRALAAHFTSGNPANTTGVVLPPERLVLAATHTHQGPGNYLSAENYNALGSSRSGFNKDLRGYLKAQIIGAIERAIVDARSTTEVSVDILTGSVDATLFRNRSPRVFMLDDNHRDILVALGSGIPADKASCAAARLHDEPKDGWDIKGCPRLRAVDRNVTLLRMRRAGRTHALALFVNVHPTVLAQKTELNSADLFAATSAAMEQHFGDTPPVIGFFNGSEGDVVTRRTTRTATDLRAMGESFARQIQRIHDRSATLPVDITLGIRGRLHYAQPGEAEPPSSPPIAKLASEALGGVATLGGGEGDETFLSHFIWRRTRRPTGEQGVKVPALGWFGRLVAPPHKFPRALPLGVIRLGTLTLVTTPTENSTAAVWQIRKTLGNPSHGALEVLSMANEYASYLSTTGEYQAQDYMGASTLWGPQQSDFFAAALARIAGEPDGTTGIPGADLHGPSRKFDAGDVGRWRRRPIDGYGNFLAGGFVEATQLPTFQWCEAKPDPIAAGDREVEVVAVDGSLHDRYGIAVVLRGIRKNPYRAIWAAIWMTPLWAERRGVYRFRVAAGGPVIESNEFAVGSSPASACGK